MVTSTESRENYILRVRQAREHAGLKQEDIADFIGVARNTYTNYELRRAMPQKYIAKFCEITKVSEKWLLTGQGNMTGESIQLTDKEIEDIMFRRGLRDQDRQDWDAMVKLQKKLYKQNNTQ